MAVIIEDNRFRIGHCGFAQKTGSQHCEEMSHLRTSQRDPCQECQVTALSSLPFIYMNGLGINWGLRSRTRRERGEAGSSTDEESTNRNVSADERLAEGNDNI